jgi:ribosomal protein S18 acetylase RimI-like enzyme
VIREATSADRETIAALHIASWRTAYRGILPDSYIDGALERDLNADWVAKFADTGTDRLILLAVGPDGADGFTAIKIADGWAEIDNLHVSPRRRGGGIGRALLAEAAGRLIARGIHRAYLGVFTANAPAIAFYERIGGLASGRETAEIHGNRAELIRYEWPDLTVLRDGS